MKKKPLGEVLRRIREEAGISQRDLARTTGMPVGQISMLETSGRPNPGFLTIAKLAKGLHVSLDALASECAWGDADAATSSSLAPSERDHLAMLREIETAKNEAQKVTTRLEALLQPPTPRAKKPAKRKRPS